MSMSAVHQAHGPRFERLYGSTNATQDSARSERLARQEAASNDDGDERRRADNEGPGRRNPLVGALMQALKGLMGAAPGSTATPTAAAAPATASGTSGASSSTPAGSTATTSTDTPTAPSSAELKEAAYAFANELFAALRSVGEDGGRGRERGGDDDNDHRHHHGHGHGRHRGHGDYGNFGGLVQRLQSLAASVGSAASTPAGATAPSASTATATATPSPAVPVAATTTPPAESAAAAVPATAPAAGATGATTAGNTLSLNISISVTLNLGGNTPATAQPKESPLLSAFKQLMDKLQPPATGGASAEGGSSAAASGASPADRLQAFLLTMASALQAGGRSDGAGARPGVGSLVNLQA